MFGKRIADQRQRLGLTQQDLADRWQIGRSAVGMIETDRSPLDVTRLVALADAGFDILYVMTGEVSAVAAARLLNWDLVSQILEGIRRWAGAHQIVLPSAKEVLILKLLYEHFAASGVVDEAAIDQALRIAA